MTQLSYVGTWSNMGTTGAPAITDIEAFVLNQRLFVVSSSGAHGELISWEWWSNQLFARDREPIFGTSELPAAGGLEEVSLGGVPTLLAWGGAGQGVSSYTFGGNGQLQSQGILGGQGATFEQVGTLQIGSAQYVLSAARGEDELSMWRVLTDNSLRLIDTEAVSLPGDGPLTPGMAHWDDGATEYLLTLDAQANAVLLYRMTTQGFELEQRLTPEDGMALQTPIAVEVVEIAGTHYALVAASDSNSITVLRLSNGQMEPVDHVIDDLNTRFDGITGMEVLEHEGQVFVLVSGQDDGLTLMTLLPGGQLLALDSLEDQTDAPLSDITALEMVSTSSSEITIFAAGEGWDGLSALEVDLGTPGLVHGGQNWTEILNGTNGRDVIDGGGGSDRIFGAGGDDILIDGAGSDRLTGGAGADVFVLVADGNRDRIEDFELGVDRINLSLQGLGYGLDALNFAALSGGISVQFGSEWLDIYSADGRAINPNDLTADMFFDLAHMPVAPVPGVDRMVSGTNTDDVLVGGAGNDTLLGGDGGDVLVGEAGDDWINATVEAAFDTTAGQVVRLYQTTLGRAPDLGGFMGWAERLESGSWTPLQAAAAFTQSREFQDVYGPTSDAAFVTLMYNNVLGRDPDAASFAVWQQRLADGMPREEVVLRFAESAEFQESMREEVLMYSQSGLEVAWSDDVFRLYQATLGRAPDPVGFEGWVDRMVTGTSFLDAISGFMNSREFQQTYGQTSDADFVTLLYNNVLGRDPDAAGLEVWLDRLAGGMSREEVVSRFAQSQEFVTASMDDLVAFMQSLGVDDVLEGGEGDDLLFGGALCDRFIFDGDLSGQDTIIGIEAWDEIVLRDTPFSTGAQALAAARQVGDDVVLDIGETEIIFAETNRADLSADMFIFE